MRRVTAELTLGLAGVSFLGEIVREKTGLRTFNDIFSTKQYPRQAQSQCSVRHFEWLTAIPRLNSYFRSADK